MTKRKTITYGTGLVQGQRIAAFFIQSSYQTIKNVFPDYTLGEDVTDYCYRNGHNFVYDQIQAYEKQQKKIHVGNAVFIRIGNTTRKGVAVRIFADVHSGSEMVNAVLDDGDTICTDVMNVQRIDNANYDFKPLFEFLRNLEEKGEEEDEG